MFCAGIVPGTASFQRVAAGTTRSTRLELHCQRCFLRRWEVHDVLVYLGHNAPDSITLPLLVFSIPCLGFSQHADEHFQTFVPKGSGGALHPDLGLQGQARSLSLSCIQGTGLAPGASIKGTSRGGYGLHLGLHLQFSSCDAEVLHQGFASGLSTFILL